MVDKKKDKVKFETNPETNEQYISVTCGCISFIHSYSFLSDSLDKSVEISAEVDCKNLKKELPDHWEILNKNLSYPYENFNSIEDYQEPVDNLKKEDFLRK